MTTTNQARPSCGRSALVVAMIAAATVLGAGCDDDGETETSPTTSSGSGGSGGTAGEGGTGGSGGAAGAGGSGGSPGICLAASEHEGAFTIEDTSLCLVGKYTAAVEVGYAVSPTWGRHDGPLTIGPASEADQVTLSRWSVPKDPTGTLSASDVVADLAITADPIFIGPEAIDLPFNDWTLVSYTGDFSSTDGEAILLDVTSVAARFPVVGFYAAGSAGIETAGAQRLIHTSQTPLDDAQATQAAGLYAADFCSGPSLCNTELIDAWGEASGPVAVDQDGHVFAVQASFSTNKQSLRVYEASAVAAMEGPVSGVELFDIDGFGSELVATRINTTMPGHVLFQPFDGGTYAALDVIGLRYTVSDSSINVESAAATALTMTEPGTEVALMIASDRRIWVGVPSLGSGETTFYVLGLSE